MSTLSVDTDTKNTTNDADNDANAVDNIVADERSASSCSTYSSPNCQRNFSEPDGFNIPPPCSLSQLPSFNQNIFLNFIDNDTTYFNVTEKYSYNFDFPNSASQIGYVEITNNKIRLMFPELLDSPRHFHKYAHTQSIQLIINRHVMFSYDWLPIYSVKDFYRVKDMLSKAFHEYSNRTQRNHFIAQKVIYNQIRQFNLLSTVIDTDKFHLTCNEDDYSSIISLDLKCSDFQLPDQTEQPIEVEIYIGHSLMFCTSRDLETLDSHLQHFVTQFILHKLIKNG
jgi:hypothetical protein